VVSLRNFELFSVDQAFVFEVDPMFVVSGQSQVIFSHADGILVLEKEVQVLVLEFFWDLEVAPFGNVVSSKFIPGSAGNVAFDGSADISRSLVREWIHLILLDLNDAHDVIPLDGDFVWATVLDDDLAILVAVDADQRGYSGQCWCSWAVNHCHIGLVRVHLLVEFGRDDAGGQGQNGYLFGCANRVHFGVGKFDLPRVHVVDQLVAVHEVDANDVVVQLGDHVHRVSKFPSFDPEVHFIDPYGVHCVSGCGDAALGIQDFPWSLGSECCVK
jgi:hypothetical protein